MLNYFLHITYTLLLAVFGGPVEGAFSKTCNRRRRVCNAVSC